jgi:hypothetical protein
MRKALVFDPVKKQFIDADGAPSKTLKGEYRNHWATPGGA